MCVISCIVFVYTLLSCDFACLLRALAQSQIVSRADEQENAVAPLVDVRAERSLRTSGRRLSIPRGMGASAAASADPDLVGKRGLPFVPPSRHAPPSTFITQEQVCAADPGSTDPSLRPVLGAPVVLSSAPDAHGVRFPLALCRSFTWPKSGPST